MHLLATGVKRWMKPVGKTIRLLRLAAADGRFTSY
jgi:hypothetical protein